MMGILLEYNTWKEHGIEGLQSGANLGYIKCFSALYKCSETSKYESIKEILEVILKSRISYSIQVNKKKSKYI